MREIKFRAWDKKQKKWRYFELDEILEKGFANWQDLETDSAGVIKKYQYTGLHDKDKKEIYEGDVILTKWREEEKLYKVYIDEETQQQSIESIDEDRDLQGLYDYHFECRVIGNIYNNPNLIK